MTTRSDWKRTLDDNGIKVWVCEKVVRIARGKIIDEVINRTLEYRDESLRLFDSGNIEASVWAGRAMQDRAIEMDNAIAEKIATQAGRQIQQKAITAAADKKAAASAHYADWQERANIIWQQPQHAYKSASDVANLIIKQMEQEGSTSIPKHGTMRRRIKKLS